MSDHSQLSFIQNPRSFLFPLLSLLITLTGIFLLKWILVPVIFFFWWEVILIVSSALIRMFFSLDGRGFFDSILIRLFLLVTAGVLGGTLVMFAILFSLDGVHEAGDWGQAGFGNIYIQTMIMTIGAGMALVFNFFANGRFRIAQPFGELMVSFAHILFILSFLMVFTKYLLPKYPQLGQAKSVALAVVIVKFGADLLFLKFGKSIQEAR